MFSKIHFPVVASILTLGTDAAKIQYDVPMTAPSTAAELDHAPIGVSFEFFMWPSYMKNITPPLPCLEHFTRLYGQKIPIRIGGTTQDRATFDPGLDTYISYSVADPLDAPMDLTFGPKFFDLIGDYGADTILGFNRGRNNRTNTFSAILEARKRASEYITAIELGNEPDLYLMWEQPIATPPWNETQDGASNADWAQAFIDMWPGEEPILVGGSYAVPIPLAPNWPNTDYLIKTAYNATVKDAIKTYSGHLYALSNGTELEGELSHMRTVSDVNQFVRYIQTARSVGKEYILGETNFHGLDEEMDRTFGGALVTLDRSLKATSIGLRRLFYHQGTNNQAFFNWWSDDQVEAPFYGGYVAALALHGGDKIIAGDNGSSRYAQYVVYSGEKASKVILLNTDYFSGNGTRGKVTFELKGLPEGTVKVLRFTAESSEAATQPGSENPNSSITIGGQYFDNRDCAMLGAQIFEEVPVRSNQAAFEVAASEALIVHL